MINLFSITFKEFKGDVKDFFQPGFHRGGHGRQSGGEARGEHADQRVTTVMMMDMMMMMMMMSARARASPKSFCRQVSATSAYMVVRAAVTRPLGRLQY